MVLFGPPDAYFKSALLADPLVRVAPSSIPGAGDGVFATTRVPKGTAVTWVEEKEYPPADPYREDWFEWYDAVGAYSGADVSNRKAHNGPVGHLINDGACLAGLPDEAAVFRYVATSASRENAVVVGSIVYAATDLEPGAELFRNYGLGFWLPFVESSLMPAMQYARCDLRLAASVLRDHRILDRARALFETYRTRILSLAAITAAAAATKEPPWTPNKAHRDFEGYGIYYALLMPPQIRVSYATRLGLYDDPYLFDPKERETIARLHALSRAEFQAQFETHLCPPFGGDHYDRFILACEKAAPLGNDPALAW